MVPQFSGNFFKQNYVRNIKSSKHNFVVNIVDSIFYKIVEHGKFDQKIKIKQRPVLYLHLFFRLSKTKYCVERKENILKTF